MANKVFNMAGGLHSAAAYSAFEDALYGSCVANDSSLAVSAGTGMNVTVAIGNGLISTGTGFARRIATDATNTVSLTAASTANPRIDAVVAYIDNAVTPTTSVVDNTNGVLKFKSVAGSPAATPSAPTAQAIQSSVGAGNPYMVLAYVAVAKNATAAGAITDVRKIAGSTRLVMSNVDIGEGAPLPEGTIYGVYE
jgi:hypothetical protein